MKYSTFYKCKLALALELRKYLFSRITVIPTNIHFTKQAHICNCTLSMYIHGNLFNGFSKRQKIKENFQTSFHENITITGTLKHLLQNFTKLRIV